MGEHTARTAYTVTAAAGAALAVSVALLALWGGFGAAPPPPQDAGENTLAFLALYSAGLADDGARSLLPAPVQEAMGGMPFEFGYTTCYPGRACVSLRHEGAGWDHESYLRSVGGNLAGVCDEGYGRFVRGEARVMPGALRDVYMKMCTASTPTYALDEKFVHMLHVMIPRLCPDAIGPGWVLNADNYVELPSPSADPAPRSLLFCMGLEYGMPGQFPLPTVGTPLPESPRTAGLS